MDITYFRIGDQVVLERPSSVCVMTKGVEAALKKGPLTVTEVLPVPPPECSCGTAEYDWHHKADCPKSADPWGFVGHPQWLVLTDRDGNVLQNNVIAGAPARFSGVWFVKATPVATAS